MFWIVVATDIATLFLIQRYLATLCIVNILRLLILYIVLLSKLFNAWMILCLTHILIIRIATILLLEKMLIEFLKKCIVLLLIRGFLTIRWA